MLYENDFSDAASLDGFTQQRGEWVIEDGKLYLASLNEGCVFSYIAYTGDETGYVGLASDYTVEVDLYDVMAAAGVLTYVDTSLFSGENENTFYGYLSFASNDATKAALGASDSTGTYGNIKVSGGVLTPGNDYHIVVTHLDGNVSFSFTDIESGEEVFSYTTAADKWSTGSFGFRMRGENGGNANTMVAAFDNLKVTVTGEEAALINAGFAPNAEIVYDAEKAPAVTEPIAEDETTAPADETAPAVVTTDAGDDDGDENGGFPIWVIVAVVAVIAVVAVVAVKGKKK